MTLDLRALLPFRFELDYVCASCGRRFAPGDGHDFAACADGTRSTDAGIYAAGGVRAE